MKTYNCKSLIAWVLLYVVPILLFGQKEKKPETWFVQLNLQHIDILALEEISIGQLGVSHDVKLRPSYTLDVQRAFFKNPGFKFFFTGQLGYYANLYSDHWRFWGLGLGIEKRIFQNFLLSLRLNLGRTNWHPKDVRYVFEDGVWVNSPNRDDPTSHNFSAFRLDIGYRLIHGKHPLDVILNPQVILLNHTDFGMIPYGGAGLGVRYGL